MHQFLPPKRPFERVQCDHLGTFTTSSKGIVHLLVVMDALTKYVKLFLVKSTKSKYVIDALEKLFMGYRYLSMV